MLDCNEDNSIKKRKDNLSLKEMIAFRPFFEIPDKPITLTCKETCTKWFVVVFNTIFTLISLSIVAVGVWMLKDETVVSYLEIAKMGVMEPEKYVNETLPLISSMEIPETGRFITICIISLGTVSLIISLLGGCGAFFHDKILIKIVSSLIDFRCKINFKNFGYLIFLVRSVNLFYDCFSSYWFNYGKH